MITGKWPSPNERGSMDAKLEALAAAYGVATRYENFQRRDTEVAPESVIVSPAPDTKVGARVDIWGWAWADGGVAKVEISTDGGASWREAALAGHHGWAWQKFRIAWMPERNGEAILMSRATSTRGALQPAADWRNSVYAVPVTVA